MDEDKCFHAKVLMSAANRAIADYEWDESYGSINALNLSPRPKHATVKSWIGTPASLFRHLAVPTDNKVI